jgi:uncharacterized protein
MVYSAFILGLISSLHCVGMCGPIALMLPYTEGVRMRILKETMTYNLGRVLTYSILGLLFGYLGKGLALVGLQQSLSIFFGLIFIVIALLSIFYKKNLLLNIEKITVLSVPIKNIFSRFIKNKNAHFVLGMANGLLPCGIVWWALAASMLTFNPVYSAQYMLFFGLGTMPLMMATVLVSKVINKSFVRQLYGYIPVYQLILGVFFIWRAYSVDPSVFWVFRDAPICH